MVFMREYEVVRVDKSKKVGMSKQALCEEVVFPLPDDFVRMANMSPHPVKPKPLDKILMEAPMQNERDVGVEAEGIKIVG